MQKEGLSEFGVNYKEFYHKPKDAIKHLLKTKEGQVAGAFYRPDLGDINLVWGDSNKGLKHILERRTSDKGRQAALKFIEELPELIQNGEAKYGETRVYLYSDKAQAVISLDYKGNKDNKWIVTGYWKN
ncbi:hypothetical protein [Helicobacter sp. 11S02629-2]|uniref:putative barnase/colicin E5 family endoribonuclease n=1 Tax=Helicobacter sp. 11S02629-2 TaxID=1476195 RepID=UPI000BA6ECE0|nr:hypothetical protein [Helicobacter sp. 11S02629-2]PAF41289.1 hypothetical protein BKH40_08455 [Helicobacter sp. 11S02629-2]